MHRHPWLGLPLEEGVVELLVVDVYLAQLGAHLLPLLGLHALRVLLLLQRFPHLHDPGFLQKKKVPVIKRLSHEMYILF